MAQQEALPYMDHPYDTEHPDQFVRVHLPPSYDSSSKLPVVVIIHGGCVGLHAHLPASVATTIHILFSNTQFQ